jgi:SAM-dependent methyltransferase
MNQQRNEQYWKDVHKGKFRFASNTNDSTILPWDIKTFDHNLKMLLDFLNLPKGKLLELGCGTGNDAKYLFEQGFDVTAIDISEDAIELAKQNTCGLNIDYIVGDFFKDLPNKQYDIVYDRGFLHNYQDNFLEIFEKLNNILSKNGKYIFISGNPNQPIIKTCMPPPVFLGEIESYSSNWFKVVFVKEIVFKVDQNYNDCLGYIFLLEKRPPNPTI